MTKQERTKLNRKMNLSMKQFDPDSYGVLLSAVKSPEMLYGSSNGALTVNRTLDATLIFFESAGQYFIGHAEPKFFDDFWNGLDQFYPEELLATLSN